MIKQRKPLHSRYFRVFEAKPVKTLYNRAFSSVSPLKEPVPDELVPINSSHQPDPCSAADPCAAEEHSEIRLDSAETEMKLGIPLTIEDHQVGSITEESPQEKSLREALQKLSIGDFFHNVPDKMKANVPVWIEAGIAKEVTQEIFYKLQLQGEIKVRKNIIYDPLGTEIKLDVDRDMAVFIIMENKEMPESYS